MIGLRNILESFTIDYKTGDVLSLHPVQPQSYRSIFISPRNNNNKRFRFRRNIKTQKYEEENKSGVPSRLFHPSVVTRQSVYSFDSRATLHPEVFGVSLNPNWDRDLRTRSQERGVTPKGLKTPPLTPSSPKQKTDLVEPPRSLREEPGQR